MGSYTQLNMIPFAIDALNLSDVQGGYLFLLTAIGIGAGSLLAGKLSGKGVELGLVPIGGLGIAISFFLLSTFCDHIVLEIIFVTLIGVFGGLYIVPLDTTNFLGFFGVLLAAGMLYLLSELIGLKASTGFFVMGCFTLAIVIAITCAISGYVMRFFYMIISRYFYHSIVHGAPPLVFTKPTFYLSTLPAWPWKACLAAAQGRRLFVFQIRDQASQGLLRRLFQRLAFKREVPSLHYLEPSMPGGKLIEKALGRGTSIAIFCPPALFTDAKELIHKWTATTNSPAFLFEKKSPPLPEGYPSIKSFDASLTKL
jgi:acyl-[acyl-carrier-protein]-phospholipid O-acyltransferase/long-chain-fatty-acid--[acyl-carrier-protein] ligase